MIELSAGEKAPDFHLPDQEGNIHTLSSYKGRWVFLFFYPKDDTPGCTKEACGVRDVYAEFQKLNVMVFGISVDPIAKHQKFIEKYELPYTLLSDESKDVVEKYGVWGKKKFMGREYMGTMRMSFLIDPSGHISKVYKKVKPEAHAKEVLEDLASLQS